MWVGDKVISCPWTNIEHGCQKVRWCYPCNIIPCAYFGRRDCPHNNDRKTSFKLTEIPLVFLFKDSHSDMFQPRYYYDDALRITGGRYQ